MVAIETDLVSRSLAQGRYHIRRRLGEGSMGLVFLAWDTRLNTEIVIKVPTGDRLRSEEFHARFLQESRLLTQLSHPRIIKILDVGDEGGIPYYVMPYVNGGNLLDRIRQAGERKEKLAPESLTDWLPDIAEALDFMHDRGYVHRDVKPANILFDEYGHAYLSDFGLSKVLQDEETQHSGLTAANAVVGTPNYVAPELVLARRDYDGKVDQYSLAVTIYEVLAGKPPLEGDSPTATMVNQTTMHPKSLTERNRDVPPALAAAVRMAMSKRPWRRYENCGQFAGAVLGSLEPPDTMGITHSSRSSATGYSTIVEGRPELYVAGVSRGHEGQLPCPRCGRKIALKTRYAGQRGACVHCKAQLAISKDLREIRWIRKVKLAASDSSLPVRPDTSNETGPTLLGLHFSSRRSLWWTLAALATLLLLALLVGRWSAS